MRILIIKPKHIGDTILLTPTLSGIHQAYPDAKTTVVVRRGCESILLGCPFLERVLTLAAVEKHERRWSDTPTEIGTWLRLLATSFDYVFELGDGHRGRLLATTVSGKKKFSVRPANPLKHGTEKGFSGISKLEWESIHRVEKDFRTVDEFLPLTPIIPPLCFEKNAARDWAPAQGMKDIAIMQIGKRQTVSRWPKERWLKVAKEILPRLDGLIISTGKAKDEVSDADWLVNQLGKKAIASRGEPDWPEMAGLFYRAKFYVGVDTAAMHLAAACNCRTIALFGPTWEQNWAPWEHEATILTGNNPAKSHAECKKRSMLDITEDEVIEACFRAFLFPA
jgi:heptosyltransferase-3